MKIKNYVLIILCVCVLFFLLIFCKLLKIKKTNHYVNTMTNFVYKSGSSSHSIYFNGKKNVDKIDIKMELFLTGELKQYKKSISISDLEKIINSTKVESCNKQTYSYQCGNLEGCSSATFYLNFKNKRDML